MSSSSPVSGSSLVASSLDSPTNTCTRFEIKSPVSKLDRIREQRQVTVQLSHKGKRGQLFDSSRGGQLKTAETKKEEVKEEVIENRIKESVSILLKKDSVQKDKAYSYLLENIPVSGISFVLVQPLLNHLFRNQQSDTLASRLLFRLVESYWIEIRPILDKECPRFWFKLFCSMASARYGRDELLRFVDRMTLRWDTASLDLVQAGFLEVATQLLILSVDTFTVLRIVANIALDSSCRLLILESKPLLEVASRHWSRGKTAVQLECVYLFSYLLTLNREQNKLLLAYPLVERFCSMLSYPDSGVVFNCIEALTRLYDVSKNDTLLIVSLSGAKEILQQRQLDPHVSEIADAAATFLKFYPNDDDDDDGFGPEQVPSEDEKKEQQETLMET